MNKLITIAIINWNGEECIQKCIDSVLDQTIDDYELMIVDNNSNDKSIEIIQANAQKFNQFKVITSKVNLGFAGGANLAAQAMSSKYLLLLNNDAQMHPEVCVKLINYLENNPAVGTAQGKIISSDMSAKIDSCGSFWCASTLLYHFGNGKDKDLDKYNETMEVFSLKGACMITRRDIIEKVGLFDDEFWCYYEETDFCHRLWLSGYKCVYLPNCEIYHDIGFSSKKFPNSEIQFHNFKNKTCSMLKNFEWRSLITILPMHLFFQVCISVIWLALGRWRVGLSLYKAMIWNFQNIKSTLNKRKLVQLMRVKNDVDYLALITVEPRVEYYLRQLQGRLELYHD